MSYNEISWALGKSEIGAMPVAKRVHEYGACVISNFAEQRDVNMIKSEALSALDKWGSADYGYGRSCRFEPEDYTQVPTISGFFSNQFFRDVANEYASNGQIRHMQFVDVTHDFRFDPETIYGKLHHDRRHQLKFILYLTDTDSSSGAFRFVPESRNLGKKRHIRAWREALDIDSSVNEEEVLERAWKTPDDSSVYRSVEFLCQDNEQKAVHVAGHAGTLIVFDTHVLHAGGVVEAKQERLNIKGHSLIEVSA
jgi:hypothetical protein